MNALNSYFCKFKTDIKPFKTAILAVFISITAAFSVSVISSFGKQMINEEMDAMGLDGMTISAYNNKGENVTDVHLYDTLMKIEGLSNISPVILNSTTAAFSNGISVESMIWGIDKTAADIISLKMVEGRMINNGDVQTKAFVCLVDKKLADTVYKRSNICGKKIYLVIDGKSVLFTVIGTVEKGSSILNTLTGDVIPNFIYIPYTTMSSLCNKSSFDQIIFSSENTDQNATEFKNRLVDERYRYRSQTIKLTNLSSQKEQILSIADTAFTALFIVSFVAVIVCSLSVGASVNTAVISKQKDIGIKISMGASRWDIAKEFMYSALAACIIGVVSAFVCIYAVILLIELMIPVKLTLDYILIVLSVVATIILTVIFSFIPSYKAAKMSPIKALNRE